MKACCCCPLVNGNELTASYTLGILHLLVILSSQELLRTLAGPYTLMLSLHLQQLLLQYLAKST